MIKFVSLLPTIDPSSSIINNPRPLLYATEMHHVSRKVTRKTKWTHRIRLFELLRTRSRMANERPIVSFFSVYPLLHKEIVGSAERTMALIQHDVEIKMLKDNQVYANFRNLIYFLVISVLVYIFTLQNISLLSCFTS